MIARSPESGCSSSWRYSTKRVLPEKQCGTERVPPERLARPIFQACTRIAVQPAVQVLVSLRVHLEQCSESRAERDPRESAREILARKHKNIKYTYAEQNAGTDKKNSVASTSCI